MRIPLTQPLDRLEAALSEALERPGVTDILVDVTDLERLLQSHRLLRAAALDIARRLGATTAEEQNQMLFNIEKGHQ